MIHFPFFDAACTQLLVSKPDEENITLYMKLLERCVQHPVSVCVL